MNRHLRLVAIRGMGCFILILVFVLLGLTLLVKEFAVLLMLSAVRPGVSTSELWGRPTEKLSRQLSYESFRVES